jgi:hypothetical protein
MAYVIIDGTLIPIDRVAADRPFYSGKHKRHGVNLQVIASPDGTILWVSEQFNPMRVPSGDQQVGIDIAGVDQMDLGQQPSLREAGMDRRSHGHGVHVGDQMRRVGFASLGEMDVFATPGGIAFGAGCGVSALT